MSTAAVVSSVAVLTGLSGAERVNNGGGELSRGRFSADLPPSLDVPNREARQPLECRVRGLEWDGPDLPPHLRHH
eukprot:CAMPEP_0182914158 /NCGR_PEP_ID=MMETSP0034_2-20130328/38420_1 /TAXON_ID=156128 /ORGANISM="Nephroselmis pyriformis, Strain CCMP717" /LENGTH=74 /DNA_ID=CAMNT_0025050917 /DNA_START=45 /DNA_END=267 /DNA_ORIENTATION=+